jgi:hypothetical protein
MPAPSSPPSRSGKAHGTSTASIAFAVIAAFTLVALVVVWFVFRPEQAPTCSDPEVFVGGLGCTDKFLRCVHSIGLSKLTDDLKQGAKATAERGLSVDGQRARSIIEEYRFPDDTLRRLAEDCERFLPPQTLLATPSAPSPDASAVAPAPVATAAVPSASHRGPETKSRESGCTEGSADCAGGSCTLRCRANGTFGNDYRAACVRVGDRRVRCLIQGAPGSDATAECNPEVSTQGQFAWGACPR